MLGNLAVFVFISLKLLLLIFCAGGVHYAFCVGLIFDELRSSLISMLVPRFSCDHHC